MSKELFKTVILKTLPILTGYIVLGIGFGILLEKAGYHVGWAVLMALSIYSGTMQYVGVDLLTSGASLITTAVVTLMVNARYMFYGVATIDRFKTAGMRKYYMIFGLTDETYALLCSSTPPKSVSRHTFDFLITLFDQLYWVIGCILGVLIGAAMTIDSTGVEFVMTALFVTIFVDQWRASREHLPAVIGVVISVVCLILFGADRFLIPTMIFITLLLTLIRPILRRRHGEPSVETMKEEGTEESVHLESTSERKEERT